MPITVRVPDNTESIHDIGKFILSYQPYQNAFLTSLVNRIGRVIVTSKVWSNPWAVFKKGKLEYGETVEEIFANVARPHSFDPGVAENEVFKREIPDVRAAFHSMNFQKFYKVTVSNDQLRQAFLSYGQLSDLIARIVDTLYTGMELDEYLVMKYMLCREVLNGGVYAVQTPAPTTEANQKQIVKLFRQYTNDLTYLKSTFNRAHVRNATPIDKQVIIVSNAIEASIGVDVLANAFNLEYADYLGRRISVDGFTFDAEDKARLAEIFSEDATYTEFTATEEGKLETITGVKMDEDWFMVFDNFEQFTENYNGQGLYWQYFFHTWKTFSASPFANAIAFVGAALGSYTVESLAAQGTPNPGATVEISAVNAQLKPIAESGVIYTISGNATVDTQINPLSGALVIGENEKKGTAITVTGILHDRTTKTVTVTVE